MRRKDKTPFEIMYQCVLDVEENRKSVHQIAREIKVKRQFVLNWIAKYESKGIEGLIDKRGCKKSENEMSKICTISELCRIAELSRSAYYKWLNRKEGTNEQFNKSLIPLIKSAYEEKKVF